MFFRFTSCLLLVVLFSAAVNPQTSSPPASACGTDTHCSEMGALVARQFGPGFTLLPEFKPLLGDLDSDGQEDAVIVATAAKPLADAEQFQYKVLDPYDSYFGWGDPRVTAAFEPTYTGARRFVLVVHAWQAATPKAKFVIINLPFEKLSLSRLQLKKKKTVLAISALESSYTASATYWDGSRYRWRPDYVNE